MMAFRRIILLLVIAFGCYPAGVMAQSVFINTGEGIYQLTGGPGSNTRTAITNPCGDTQDILSIAVYKDTLYYITWSGALKRFVPGNASSCETLIESGFSYTSMTVDRNGVLYMGTEMMAKYDPHTRQLTDLGRMPFYSAGDMLFFGDKLLMAGWDPADWSSGIFEIDPDHLSSSKKFMDGPSFFGLLSYPVPCGKNRFYGLSPEDGSTRLIEIDLATKRITDQSAVIADRILDAGSYTENGDEMKVRIDDIRVKLPSNCAGDNGSIAIGAFSLNGSLSYRLINGTSQSSPAFDNLAGGEYRFRITDAAGCSSDTIVRLPLNAALPGCQDLFIPSAFTPNLDGKNDRFAPQVPVAFRNVRLQVFGRWGDVVYSAVGNQISWDGTFRNQPLPTGVYIYLLTCIDPSGSPRTYKGSLSLIR